MDRELFDKLASKMGITSAKVRSQAEEYSRLSQISCAGLRNATAISRAVMCLELAAKVLGHPLDKEYAVTLSGVNKSVYQSNLRSMECMLGLESHLGLRDLAIQYGCLQAVGPAAKILQRYKSSLPKVQQEELDLTKPLFTTAALLTACKCMKIRVDRKLVASSGANKAMMDRLCAQLHKFAQEICSEPTTLKEVPKTARKRKTLLESIQQKEQDEHSVEDEEPLKPPPQQRRQEPEESTKCNYEEWKRRILENALKATQPTS
ncbi:origin recognition complex subunit 6 isoform X2 [Scleropages formosus]|uniref:Origin recognition complex subunit 6 n=1 Tax=Scleropages formosus TaxID=113540 RepID=A0A8C9RSR7_SCLFO|nr:origin recognition complex subunit 6 isoform X2 [Scleropages formosus]